MVFGFRTALSSPPPVERFKGTSWKECQEFILAIRARALWEGKQRDSAWMADFAATYFSHAALPWHSRLPEDVRQDWYRLEIELHDRWPQPEEDNQPQVKPTPAAAPPLSFNKMTSQPVEGLLKVVLDGSYENYYVQFLSDESMGNLTRDASEAIHVRCVASAEGTLLELLDHLPPSWLAIRWVVEQPTIGSGSKSEAFITRVEKATMKCDWASDTPWQHLTCTVLASGEVIPVWRMNETSRVTLSSFVWREVHDLALVPDPEEYFSEFDKTARAKLFIEPTD